VHAGFSRGARRRGPHRLRSVGHENGELRVVRARARRAGVDALADDAGHARCRRDDDGEIDGVCVTPSIFGYALMRSRSGASGDREHAAAKRAADLIPQNRPAGATRLADRIDHGDVARSDDASYATAPPIRDFTLS
jgi:hypothetical protein